MNTITDLSHCFLNLSSDISMLTFANVIDTEADRNGIHFAGSFSINQRNKKNSGMSLTLASFLIFSLLGQF